jgi:hypothetical protein
VRGSWDPRAIDAWYLGPALKHYRCYRVWVWGTKSEHVADMLAWFPTKVQMPTVSSLDLVLAAAHDLIEALQHPSPGSPLAPTTDSQTAALKQLADIFMDCTARSAAVPLVQETPVPVPCIVKEAEVHRELAGASLRVPILNPTGETPLEFATTPTTVPTLAPTPTTPPGFLPMSLIPPLVQVPAPAPTPIACPDIVPTTDDATLPRVPIAMYTNTAKGSTRKRRSPTHRNPQRHAMLGASLLVLIAQDLATATTATTAAVPESTHLRRRSLRLQQHRKGTRLASSAQVLQAFHIALPPTPPVATSDPLVDLVIPKGYALAVYDEATGKNIPY